jgi:hypothetical protein
VDLHRPGQSAFIAARRRREIETTEPLPLGVVGDVVTPGRVRVGDLVGAM